MKAKKFMRTVIKLHLIRVNFVSIIWFSPKYLHSIKLNYLKQYTLRRVMHPIWILK